MQGVYRSALSRTFSTYESMDATVCCLSRHERYLDAFGFDEQKLPAVLPTLLDGIEIEWLSIMVMWVRCYICPSTGQFLVPATQWDNVGHMSSYFRLFQCFHLHFQQTVQQKQIRLGINHGGGKARGRDDGSAICSARQGAERRVVCDDGSWQEAKVGTSHGGGRATDNPSSQDEVGGLQFWGKNHLFTYVHFTHSTSVMAAV